LARTDELFVPEHEGKTEPAATSARHTFRTRLGTLLLYVTLRQWDRRGFASEPIHVEGVAALPSSVDTDEHGTVSARIHPLEEVVRVTLRGDALGLRVGHLEPVETLAGVRARLANLGYLLGRVDDDDDDRELWFALQDFQADAGIAVTGKAEASTLAVLFEEHGS